MAHPELTALYQLVTSCDGLLNEVEVLAELHRASLPKQQVAALGAALQMRFKDLVGISAKVSVLQPGAVEQTHKPANHAA